jgi:hypothetical protein
VELNHRGEALVELVCVSFTYISRLLCNSRDDHYYAGTDRHKINHYYDLRNMGLHSKHNARFLAELAFLHTLELHKIRTAYNCRDWAVQYRDQFSIHKALQLERIVRVNTAFMRRIVEWMEEGDDTRREIERNMKYMKKISELYSQQVGKFTPHNIGDTMVLNYERILDDMRDDDSLIDWTFEQFQQHKEGDRYAYVRDIGHLV